MFGHPDLLDMGTLGPLAPNIHSAVKSLGVHVYRFFKFDKQIYSVVFFQMRLVAKVKGYLPQKDLERVIIAFLTSHLDLCRLRPVI